MPDMLDHLDPFAVFAGAGVDFDLVALIHEQGHRSEEHTSELQSH